MKKNLLSVLMLALLIVNIVLNSVTMISVTGTNKKTAQLVNNIATVLDLELVTPGETPEVSMADTAVHNFEGSMTMPLANGEDGTNRYLICDIALSMNTKHEDYKTYGETMLDRESLIKDAITAVVSRHTEEDCRNDLEGLKEEILKEVQDLFQSDFIYKIAISNIKFG
ncbi:MAG: flagellar basal body-associated FliL family protein [Lachnospiraceae bacterium]|nr:flagellar basal body-associated FliL family protein [Lachnospiraceae bacterium]